MKKADLKITSYFKRDRFSRQFLKKIFGVDKYSEIMKYDPEYSFRKSLGRNKQGKCEFCGKETTLVPSNVFITIERSDPVVFLCEKCRRDFFIRKKIEDEYSERLKIKTCKNIEFFWSGSLKLFRWMMISGIEKGPVNIIYEILKMRIFYINLRFIKTKLDEFKMYYEMIYNCEPVQKRIGMMIEAFKGVS